MKADFLDRLTAALAVGSLAGCEALVRTVLDKLYSRDQLYGFARYKNLLTDAEDSESCPKVHHTVPCYLHTHVKSPAVRSAIENYVLCFSRLYERGSALLNGFVAAANAAAFESSTASLVDLWPHPPLGEDFGPLVQLLSEENDLKQFFLPERWPEVVAGGAGDANASVDDDGDGEDGNIEEGVGGSASQKKRPRHPLVAQALREHGQRVSHLYPSNWKTVMSVSGWDNALNSMGKKCRVAVQNMVTTNIVTTLWTYFVNVFARRHAFEYPENDLLEAMLSALHGAFHGRLRPLVVHQDDFALLVTLRAEVEGWRVEPPILKPAAPGETTPTPRPTQSIDVSKPLLVHAKYTPRLLAVHLFAKRVIGVNGLPEVSQARHYSYLDAKVVAKLLPRSRGCSGQGSTSTSVCAYLGIHDFNKARHDVRAACRRRYRRPYGGDQSARAKVLRHKALRQKWHHVGAGRLPRDAAIHSVETDGVGLRLGIQRPDHKAIAACVRPVDVQQLEDIAHRVAHSSVPVEDIIKELLAQRRAALNEKAKARRKGHECAAGPVPMEPLVDALGRQPAFAGGDTGRAKLLTCAVTPSACRAPDTLTLTRRRYYNAMRHHKRLRWESARVRMQPAVKAALAALSATGLHAISGCDSLRGWQARMDAKAEHYQVLLQEYVIDKQRALWKMRMMRWKRACLDQEAARIIRAATGGDKTRNLVIGIGDGGFPCTGPGELPAPTSALTLALRRAKVRRDLQREGEIRRQGTSRCTGQTALTVIQEDRTTMCCCACGAVTVAPTIRDPKTGRERPSRRLRLCTSCNNTAGKLRDRDVQAARNILWLTIYKYYGLERPEYLCRVVRSKKQTTSEEDSVKKTKRAPAKRTIKPKNSDQHITTSQALAP